MKSKNTVPSIALYLFLSLCLTAANYLISFQLNNFLFAEEFSVNYFLGTFVFLIVAESAFISHKTKNRLYAVLGTTTIPTWILTLTFFDAYYATDTMRSMEYIALNIFFLAFSYIGAFIGSNMNSSKTSSKKSRKK